jgi:hypothetical protein
MLQSIYDILIIVTLLLGIAGTIAGWFRSEKAKKIAQKLNFLKEQVETFVPIAEELGGMSGPQKKKYVMDAVQEKAKSFGYDIDLDQLSQMIESVIVLTKRVNYKEEIRKEVDE